MSSACRQCPELYMALSVWGQTPEQICLRLYHNPRNVAQLQLTGARLPMSRLGLSTGSSIAGIAFTDYTMKVKLWLASPVPLVRWHLVLIKREQLLDEAGSQSRQAREGSAHAAQSAVALMTLKTLYAHPLTDRCGRALPLLTIGTSKGASVNNHPLLIHHKLANIMLMI